MSIPVFPARTNTADIELGQLLQPKFGSDGLIPCITTDHITNEVLMFAFMNAESLAHTLKKQPTGAAHVTNFGLKVKNPVTLS